MATVLCIDQDEQYGSFVGLHLKKGGHSYIYTRFGAQALPLAEKHAPDLLISEVMLPDVCGFEIARRIRAHEDLHMLPIILTSTMCEEDEVRHALAQGIDGFLPKPFNPAALLTLVKHHLTEVKNHPLKDTLTGLSGQKKIRAELQRAIALKHKFSALYIEITGLAEFARKESDSTRDKLLVYFTKVLDRCREKTAASLFHAGHFGNGHFFCIVDEDKATALGEHLQHYWKSRIEKDLAPLSATSADLPGGAEKNGLDLMIYITGNATSSRRSAQEYFETLAQLRKKDQPQKGGIIIDNRRAR
ncbi:MAG TPA: response regulator [Candidatus Hydrogenedentes bacterium]|nr:MAG: Alkaline phosphatase synthesis transcriptional regulatory protein PhoP [Candidatus Hydrogenedentes bacterium ADurb.Bin170]HNZ49707.1 response regulator [Candidatus Hydrogenedentota bacterium]HOD95479.1 response regulator [Candidatus Hydrogenedentota bacterium]HOH43322.1 response regulator [Candidatus Hydrogenedentota bacterium]HOR50712.1 response regulator [Candidatus Hydrogenedentota bacterium]